MNKDVYYTRSSVLSDNDGLPYYSDREFQRPQKAITNKMSISLTKATCLPILCEKKDFREETEASEKIFNITFSVSAFVSVTSAFIWIFNSIFYMSLL